MFMHEIDIDLVIYRYSVLDLLASSGEVCRSTLDINAHSQFHLIIHEGNHNHLYSISAKRAEKETK